MLAFLKRQVGSLMQWLRSQPRLLAWGERAWPELEKFIIAGPTLLGFVLGLVRYQPATVHFETGFQSMVIFLAYLAGLTVLQAADSLLFSSWPVVLGVARSLLATVYLIFTLRQFMQWRTGHPHILPAVLRIREKLRAVTGNAT
ncbi:MAG: hypothetical protein ACOY5B_01895 [Spirochaetota bacterium]